MTEVDVLVVGAGVAGLAAAAALRRAGRTCLVLEAAARPGGRAHTIQLGAESFDLGATWLHDAARNKLADLARAAGDALEDADATRHRTWLIDGRPATPAEEQGFHAASAAFDALCHARAQQDPDTSVAEAIAPLRDDPWMATVETWEAAQIAAADPWRFSVRDWSINDLGGANLLPVGGMGTLILRRLLPLAGEVRLSTPVRRIACHARGIAAETDAGTIRARAAIVTVSAGVLAAGTIAFDPPLPPATQDAIHGLPMGLLTKVGLAVTDAAALGLPPNTVLRRRLHRPLEPIMSFHTQSGGGVVAGFVGGPVAWDLARLGAPATEAFAREQLAQLLGTKAASAAGRAAVSGWASDIWHLGAYTYALPGQSGARATLGTPIADGRLVFAGEAVCTDGLAGTVGGAFLSGERAAALAA
jgi:monoamine oxidase